MFRNRSELLRGIQLAIGNHVGATHRLTLIRQGYDAAYLCDSDVESIPLPRTTVKANMEKYLLQMPVYRL